MLPTLTTLLVSFLALLMSIWPASLLPVVPPGPRHLSLVAAPAASPAASPGADDASVTVSLANILGGQINGACYSAVLQPVPGQIQVLPISACDQDDGVSDGLTLLTGLPSGENVVVYVTLLPGTTISLPGSQSLIAGELPKLFYFSALVCDHEHPDKKCADISIEEADGIAQDSSVCYAIFWSENDAPGKFLTLACDAPADGKPRTGSVEFHGISPGGYQVAQIDETGAIIGDPMPLTIVQDEKVKLDWQGQ